MEYRRMGKSGLKLSALSLGSWLTFGKQISDNTAKELMAIAYDHGVNFFDNAEIYAKGESERVMGRILKELSWPRDSYCVSSKAFFGKGGELPTQKGLHRKHLREACDEALQRLQADYLDLYFCHRPDKETPVEETVWTMNQLIQSGKVLYWGTSQWSAQEIMEAHLVARQHHLIGPVVEQPQYNMFYRDRMEKEYLRLFETVGLGTTIWSPLASGVLSGKYNEGMPAGTRLGMEGLDWLKEAALTEERIEKTRKLSSIASRLEISMSRLAIAWCLKNPNVSTVILGASKTAHLLENLKALNDQEKLNGDVMAEIDSILDNRPVLPNF